MAQEHAAVPMRPPSTAYEPSRVTPYVVMVDRFLSGRMPVAEFETAYMRTFLDDATHWPEPIYLILNENFLDVEAFEPDPTIWDELTIGEVELRSRVAGSLSALHRSVEP